jgi:Ca2+-binding RTX toxin-like protein
MAFSIGDFFPLPGSRMATRMGRRPGDSRARGAAARPQRRSPLTLEPVEPRVLLSADPVPAGYIGALTDGLEQLIVSIDDQLTGSGLLGNAVPGIVIRSGTPDSPREAAPTLGEALTLRTDVTTAPGFPPLDAAGVLAPKSGSLVDRYDFALNGSAVVGLNAEARLNALDIDYDGSVSVAEAFKVLVVGQLDQYLSSNPIFDIDEDSDIDTDDMRLQIAKFFAGTLGAGAPAFGVPLAIDAYIDFDILGVGSAYDGDTGTLTWSFGSFGIDLTGFERLDLGYEADQLNIALAPGVAAGKQVLVTRSLDLGPFAFGLRDVNVSPVAAQDFFFVAPGGVSVGLAFDTPANGPLSLDNVGINIGFLGAKITSGDIALDMGATSAVVDPSDPIKLGFTKVQQGQTQAEGTLLAAEEPDLALPAQGIEFALKVGSTGAALPVTVSGNFGSVGDLATAVQNAVNARFGAGVVGVSVVGGKLQLDMTADPSPNLGANLGLAAGQSGAAGVLTATSPSALIGQAPPVQPVSFWLQVAGKPPKLVTVTVAGDPLGPNGVVGGGDDGQVSASSLALSVQQGLNAAGFTTVVAQVAPGNLLRLVAVGGLPIELPKSLRLDDVEQITFAELGNGSGIFDFEEDPGASFKLDLNVIALPGLELENSSTDYLPTGRIYADAAPFSSQIKLVTVDAGASRKADFPLYDGPGGASLLGGQSAMQQMLDFSVITTSDVIGIINEIGNFLDRLTGTELLQAYDLPFGQGTLGQFLQLKDLITDALLIDDGDDGLTKPKNDGTNPDGKIADLPRLLAWLPVGNPLNGDRTLKPLFSTAQQLEDKLADLLVAMGVYGLKAQALAGIDASVRQTDLGGGKLRQDLLYNIQVADVSLTARNEAVNLPLDFAMDLAPLGGFVAEGGVKITADGAMDFTLGIQLGNAVKALNITQAGAPTNLVDDLNSGNGVRVNTNQALTSLGVIQPLVGRISANANFTITLFEGGAPTNHPVTLSSLATLDNSELYNAVNPADNTTLIADLNAALATAGLGSKIQAKTLTEMTGGTRTERIVLQAIDPNIRGFNLLVSTLDPAYTELGLRTQAAATVSVLAPDVVSNVAPGGGFGLDFDVVLTNGSTKDIGVVVSGAAVLGNVSLASLVSDINDALAIQLAAQGLAPQAIVASQSGGRLAFSALTSDVRGFTVQTGSTALGMGTAALTAGVVLQGGGTVVNTFGRLTGETGNLSFNLNGITVTVTQAAAENNTDLNDLVADLNSAIGATALNDKVVAGRDGLRIVFRAVDPTVAALTITNTAGHTGPGAAFLGFKPGATSFGAQPALVVASNSTAPVSYGVLSDTSFQVSVTGSTGSISNRTVTLTAAGTVLNRSAFDLAASLNIALNSAFVGGAAANPLVAVVQGGQLVIGLKTTAGGANLFGTPVSGLPTIGQAQSFSITVDPASRAAIDLQLKSGSSSHADLRITFANGDVREIALDNAAIAGVTVGSNNRLNGHLGDLLAGIVAQAGTFAGGNRLAVELGGDGSSLRLVDRTFVPGGPNATEFQVSTLNGSPAALQLGILGTDTSRRDPTVPADQPAPADGRIDGSRIATVDLLDRVFLEDVSLHADLTITASADASATATFGIVGIKLTPESSDLFKARLEIPFLNAIDGKPLSELFGSLGQVDALVDLVGLPTLSSSSNFNLKLELLEPIEGLATALNLPANAKVGISFSNLGVLVETVKPGTGIPTVQLQAPQINVDASGINLGDLKAFESLNFQQLIAVLRAVSGVLNSFADYDFLEQDIPLLGVSVDELLTIADKFAKAIDELDKSPSASLQSLAQKLREAFGLPKFDNVAARDAFFASLGIPDPGELISFVLDKTNAADPLLRMDLRLPVGFSRALPVDLSLGDILPGGLGPVSLKGGANLAASGYLDARLSFAIELDNPTNILIYDDVTGIHGGLKASADRLAFNASVGPLGVFVRDGTVELGASFSATNNQAGSAPVALGSFLAGLSPQLTGTATATLPVYFPTDSVYLGDIALNLTGANALTLDGTGLKLPNFADALTLPDFSNIDFSSLNVFDSIPLMLDALDVFLQGLQDALDGEIAGVQIPLIGDQLAGGVDFIEKLRKDILQPIRSFVEQAPELGAEFMQALLFELLGPTSAQGTVGDQSIESLLGIGDDISGLGLLKKYDGTNDALTQGDIVRGGDSANDDYNWKFRLGQSYKPNIDFDFDIGIPALSLQADVGLDVTIDWDLAMGLGLSTADGPYIFIGNQRTGAITDDEELQLTIKVELAEGSNLTGSLGFLQLSIDAVNTPDSQLEFDRTFAQISLGVDLINKADPADAKLSFSELGSLDAKATISAEAEVNLQIEVAFNEALLTDTITSLLPSVHTRFVLDWETGNLLDSANFNFANSLKTLGFRQVEIDLGSFIGDFLGPFVSKVAEVTQPLQPIIDVITAPIPVISDLAGQPISLIDLAGMTGYVDPSLIYAVADIITLVNTIGAASSLGQLLIPVGDFMLLTQNNNDPAQSIGGGFSAAGLMTPGYSFSQNFDEEALKTTFSSLAGDVKNAIQSAPASGSQVKTKEITSSLTGPNPSLSGFDFPIFSDPSLIFGLLLGQDIPLVTYDLPPFGMEFTYVQKFPIWGPLFARIGGSVGLTIDLAFGYDTAGVREFADGKFSNPLDLLGGFYISDTDQPTGQGTDVPELVLKGELFAGAEINLGIGSAGVEGVIGLVVDFDLFDPNADGKVRVDELVGNFLYELNYGSPALAPIAIFDVSGEVYAQLRAFIELLFFEKTFNITPPITLFEFSIPFEREPFLATERGDGSLLLNIGPNAGARLNGDTRDIDETITVRSLSSSEVLVWGMGIRESDAQKYRLQADKGIVGYGGAGNDVIDLSQVAHGIVYLLEGGVGDDVLKGSAGGGTMRGDAGNDQLFGGAGVDRIFGGEGNDFIRAGASADIVFGDTGTVTKTTLTPSNEKVDRFRSVVGAKDGDDDIDGEGGNDIIFGGGGRDLIRGGAGNDLIFGDGGSFDMGPGNQLVLKNGRVDLAQFNARGEGAADTIYGDGGDDVILGGAGDDRIDGGADNDVVDAGIGFDVVYGGSGADWLFGGDNDDIVFGYRDPSGAVFGFAGDTADLGGAVDVPAAIVADGGDLIDGGEGNDYLRGQGGNDTVMGGRGNDILFGDTGNDTVLGGDGSDILFGGADNDTMDGGAGGDTLFGDDGLVVYVAYGPAAAAFLNTGSRIRNGADGTRYIGDDDVALATGYAADTLNTSMDLVVTRTRATDGNDTIAGGDGNDIAFGGGGNDTMFGDFDPAAGFSGPRPFGQDILVGDGGRVEMFGRRNAAAMAESGTHDGNDTLQGNDGSDYLFGGGGTDTLYGFQQAGGASLPNVSDNDILLGDNGVMRFDVLDSKNRVKSVQTTSIGGGNDVIYGQQGNDIAFGGLGLDTIQGQDGDDILVGDHGEVRFDLTPNLDVLDRVRSFADGLGDGDAIFGDAGNDIAIGGTGGDIIHGNAGDDILLGDNGQVDLRAGPGRLLVQVAAMPTPSAVLSIATTDMSDAAGGVDTITGDAGADIAFGGVAGDELFGDSAAPVTALDGADVLVGDNGRLLFDAADLFTLVLLESFTDGLGGNDRIRGNAGGDVVIGGTGADAIWGDNEGGASGAADGADIMAGDNARLVLRKIGDGEVPQLTVLGAGVRSIGTTDAIDAVNQPHVPAANLSWIDTISGQAGGDVILGGLAGDFLYGAALAPIHALDGADIIVGDNGELDFDVDGDLGVLNLIRSARDNLGGNDQIHGHAGGDVAIGGTGADQIYGDNLAAAGGASDGDDILLGDNADVVLRKLIVGEAAQIIVRGGGVQWITTTDLVDDKSWSDAISGNAGRDIMAGGVAGDWLYGDQAVTTEASRGLDRGDILLGDNGRLDFDLDGNLNSLDRIQTFLDALGGDDVISGNAGADVAFGGTGGDQIFGDDTTFSAAALDGNDILLGDNGVIDLVTAPLAAPTAQGIRIYGGAVAVIRSTDDGDGILVPDANATAGSDTIEGNAGADIILGGSQGDQLHGDRAVITSASNALDGADIMLGDNGRLEWLSAGRLSDIAGIDLAATNGHLWNHFLAGADTNVDTLDLITTEQPNNGGRDLIVGGHGGDVAFGGTDSDLVFGDTAGALVPNNSGNDLIFGDHGRLYPQFSRSLVGQTLTPLVGINGRNFFAIDTGAADGGDGDIVFGEEGDDIMLGQQGDDRIFGGSGDDDMIGGHNVAGGVDEMAGSGFGAVSVAGTWSIALAEANLLRGGAWNDAMDGGTGNDAMAGDNATIWRRGDTLNARYRAVDGATLYSTSYDTVTVNVQGKADLGNSVFWRPELGTSVGRDIGLLDHSDTVEAAPLGRFGNDLMAGGAGNDTMFGQLGDDLMQGDGSLSAAPNDSKGLFDFTDTGTAPGYWSPDRSELGEGAPLQRAREPGHRRRRLPGRQRRPRHPVRRPRAGRHDRRQLRTLRTDHARDAPRRRRHPVRRRRQPGPREPQRWRQWHRRRQRRPEPRRRRRLHARRQRQRLPHRQSGGHRFPALDLRHPGLQQRHRRARHAVAGLHTRRPGLRRRQPGAGPRGRRLAARRVRQRHPARHGRQRRAFRRRARRRPDRRLWPRLDQRRHRPGRRDRRRRPHPHQPQRLHRDADRPDRGQPAAGHQDPRRHPDRDDLSHRPADEGGGPHTHQRRPGLDGDRRRVRRRRGSRNQALCRRRDLRRPGQRLPARRLGRRCHLRCRGAALLPRCGAGDHARCQRQGSTCVRRAATS